MVINTLCPAVHILGSQIVYCRAEGIADHYILALGRLFLLFLLLVVFVLSLICP